MQPDVLSPYPSAAIATAVIGDAVVRPRALWSEEKQPRVAHPYPHPQDGFEFLWGGLPFAVLLLAKGGALFSFLRVD